MHMPSAQMAFIHQESVDYALLVLRETTRHYSSLTFSSPKS
jgi:hypothetical protein